MTPFTEKTVRLFVRQKAEHGTHLNWFSVAGQQLGSYAIVLFEGDDTGVGSWTCMKDHESMCRHISRAQSELRDVLEAGGSHIEEWQELETDRGEYPFQLHRILIKY